MKYTKFGELFRIYRIKNGETLNDASIFLGVTNSFVSAVELGKKKVPKKWCKMIAEHYNLNAEEVKELEDAIQECSINMYLNIGKLRDETKFRPWMTKILINCCNKIYGVKKSDISYDEIEENKILQNFNDLDDVSFYELISFLEIEDRTIITLYYLDEYTTKEISEILEINESTLRSRISNIRNKIKKSIEGGE